MGGSHPGGRAGRGPATGPATGDRDGAASTRGGGDVSASGAADSSTVGGTAAGPRRAPATGLDVADLQSLLSRALQRLTRESGCSRACAWVRRPDGQTYVAAAAFEDDVPSLPTPPDVAALDSIWSLDRAIDLGEVSDPALRSLAERHGFSAGRALRSRDGEGLAVLWIGSDVERAGFVRPRTLALLDACARQLDAPIATLDATRRLALLDEKVRRLNRLSSLGDLLAEVVHEIRNPLVSVKTFLQLLPGRERDPEFTTEFREVVVDEVMRLERLLDSLVHHARPRVTAGDDEGCDVASCLESIGGLLRHRALDHDVILRTEVDAALPRVAMGEDTVRQIVINLTLNAIEVTPAGGCVELGATPEPDAVVLHVDDEGPGVPEELRMRIFEPFFSTRSDRPGGLGLSITRRLTEEGGGEVHVEASPSGGARFLVRLPRVSPSPDAND